jgi:hypothetical protein
MIARSYQIVLIAWLLDHLDAVRIEAGQNGADSSAVAGSVGNMTYQLAQA